MRLLRLRRSEQLRLRGALLQQRNGAHQLRIIAERELFGDAIAERLAHGEAGQPVGEVAVGGRREARLDLHAVGLDATQELGGPPRLEIECGRVKTVLELARILLEPGDDRYAL